MPPIEQRGQSFFLPVCFDKAGLLPRGARSYRQPAQQQPDGPIAVGPFMLKFPANQSRISSAEYRITMPDDPVGAGLYADAS